MTINVLVFPCGSEIGLEVHAALKYAKDIVLFGASSVSDHGEYVYSRYEEITAHCDSPDFVLQLNELISRLKIDIVIPAHDSVVLKLAQCQAEIKAAVAAPGAQAAEICRNKNTTYRHFSASDFVPRDIHGLDCTYPIFAKPAVGQGSYGAEKISTVERHQQLLGDGTEYVFSEYLPGAEYTVDCISDQHGVLLHASPRERQRVKAGISVCTSPVTADASILSIADEIAKSLKLRGAWFFQIKKNVDGDYRLLEIAPRIAGSMGLSRNLGINYPLLTVYAYLGRDFSVLRQDYPIRLDRSLMNCFKVGYSYDMVYLDLDDTLIINGKVNSLLMALIYQWLARDVSIKLITRHATAPLDTLAAYKISADIFSEIIHIADGSKKSTYMSVQDSAIFIDDSYRERLDVRENIGLPVFDLDALEQLMDWRH